MNNSPQIIKISQLNPSIKGQYLLIFEIAQIISRKPNDEDITCQIVDETGIITAYFNQYAKFISKGSVYELINLRCNVVDHHLRLQMIKESQLCKKPLKIGFKDMQNDLSAKFYVQIKKKQQGEKLQVEKSINKSQNSEQQIQQQKKEEPAQKNGPQKKAANQGQAHTPKQTNQKKQKKNIQKQSNVQIKQQKKKYIQKKIQFSAKQENSKEYNFHRQEDRQKRSKKIYVAKKQTEKNQQIRNIKLNQIHLYVQKQVNLFAKVLKDRIQKGGYFLCKIVDSTGGIYVQFSPKAHLQENEWYHFNNFMIYGDKLYKYVAAQTQQLVCYIDIRALNCSKTLTIKLNINGFIRNNDLYQIIKYAKQSQQKYKQS